MRVLRRFAIGKDFREEDFHKWIDQLIWWIGDRFPRIRDPREHAEKIMKAALNGTKLDGNEWVGISDDFFARVIQLSGFDVKRGVGVRDPKNHASQTHVVTKKSGEKTKDIPPVDIQEGMKIRADYVADLLHKYPHLDTPVYKPKVEELAETIVKSRMISVDFILSRGKELELLSKIRESLHRQISELMKFLEIAPEQHARKQLDAKNADVGSLIAKMEAYGEVWEEYERLDALRELIQKYRMLKNIRPDGTPQLNDWELWHMTRNRPVKFTCKCGLTYELLGGFTPEEIEAALVQANEVYGFGLEAIGAPVKGVKHPIPLPTDIAAEGFAADEDLGSSPETTDDIEE